MSDPYAMQVFGRAHRLWPCPAFEDAVEVEPPGPDARCVWCPEGFEDGDPGIRYANGPAAHLECWLRQGIGGANHQRGLCICCGGDMDPDPPGLTPREAARHAVAIHEALRGAPATIVEQLRERGYGTP